MESNDTLYEILLNTDLNDLESLCQSNKQFRKVCQDKYFINQRFQRLGFNIYRPIRYTFNNLLYINRLINIAHKLIKFMISNDRVTFYNRPNKTIQDLEKISPVIAQRIVNQLKDVDKTSEWYGFFEGNLFLQYNHKGNDAIKTYDLKFYLSYAIYAPDMVEDAIDLSIDDTIEYLVNVFLNDKIYILVNSQNNHYYQGKFKHVYELEKFLDTRFIKLSPKKRNIPRYSKYI